MPADELGGMWSSRPVRFTQAIKQVGKELDREQHKKPGQDPEEPPAREHDSVELSSGEEPDQAVTVNQHIARVDDTIPGSHIDLTVG